MGIKLSPIDFSSASSGTIKLDLTSARQGLEVVNESINGISITVPQTSDSYGVPPQHKRIVIFNHPYQEAYWSIDYTLSTINAPLNQAFLRILSTQEVQDAIDSGSIDIALSARQANIGNQSLSVSSVPSLINDGNNPNTTIIEATPIDQSGSAIIIRNDGSAIWDILSAGAQATMMEIIRGNNTTGKATLVLGYPGDVTLATLYGTAQYANNVPAGGINGIIPSGQIGAGYPTADLSGTIPTSMISGALPATQVSSGYPAADIGSGALDASVTSPNYLPFVGGTVTGALTVNGQITGAHGNISFIWGLYAAALVADQSGSIELGGNNGSTPAAVQTPYIDFHSSATLRDFDSRIIATPPATTPTLDGQGGIEVIGVLGLKTPFIQWKRSATGNQPIVDAVNTDTGGNHWGFFFNADNSLSYYNWDNAKSFQMLPTGDFVVPHVEGAAERLEDRGGSLYCDDNGGVFRTYRITQINNRGSGISGIAMFSGTTAGSTAVNHGLGMTPSTVIITPKVAGISYTISVTNFTSTQVTVLQDSGTSIPFTGIAMA